MYNFKISVYGLWCLLQVRLWYFIIERIIIISTDKHGFIIRRDIVIRRDNIMHGEIYFAIFINELTDERCLETYISNSLK